jgi:hypothetical protein
MPTSNLAPYLLLAPVGALVVIFGGVKNMYRYTYNLTHSCVCVYRVLYTEVLGTAPALLSCQQGRRGAEQRPARGRQLQPRRIELLLQKSIQLATHHLTIAVGGRGESRDQISNSGSFV